MIDYWIIIKYIGYHYVWSTLQNKEYININNKTLLLSPKSLNGVEVDYTLNTKLKKKKRRTSCSYRQTIITSDQEALTNSAVIWGKGDFYMRMLRMDSQKKLHDSWRFRRIKEKPNVHRDCWMQPWHLNAKQCSQWWNKVMGVQKCLGEMRVQS